MHALSDTHLQEHHRCVKPQVKQGMQTVVFAGVLITLNSFKNSDGKWTAHVTLRAAARLGPTISSIAWPPTHDSQWDADTAAFAWAKRQIRNQRWHDILFPESE